MSARSRFIAHDGDTVMVCKHIYERSSCRIVQKLNVVNDEIRKGGTVRKLEPPVSFTRADGSRTPLVSASIACLVCAARDPRKVDYIEQRWSDGRLIVADFVGGAR